MPKVLIIEDDRSLSEALVYNLRREGYTPVVAEDAMSGSTVVRREQPDVVLLDLMLPGGSGLDVCRKIRSFSSVPIIILTARDVEIDRILGLEIGADDYVTKPFNLRELLARIKANLRRVELDQTPAETETLERGGLTIDLPYRRVQVRGESVPLQPKEFDLLVHLARSPQTVFTRDRLLHEVWKDEYVGERTVDVHIRRLRAKLERARLRNVIRTVHGVGYSFDDREPDYEHL